MLRQASCHRTAPYLFACLFSASTSILRVWLLSGLASVNLFQTPVRKPPGVLAHATIITVRKTDEQTIDLSF